MVTVRGRVLNQPAVIYQIGSNPREINENGRWNLRGVSQVLKPGRLEKWAILRITRNAQDPKGENSKFEETLRGFLRTLEHTLDKSTSKPIQLGRKTVDKGDKVALGPNFLDCQDQGINFLVIVLPDSDASTYKQIKTFGDIEYWDHHSMCFG